MLSSLKSVNVSEDDIYDFIEQKIREILENETSGQGDN